MRKGFKKSFRYFYFQYEHELGKYANKTHYKLIASTKWHHNKRKTFGARAKDRMYNLWCHMEDRARSGRSYNQFVA